MTETLDEVALLGTARSGGALPEAGPGEALVERPELAAEALERRLLLRAGARAALRDAGRRPEKPPPRLEPAPPETLAPCSPAAARLVERLVRGEHPALLPEAFALLDRARRRLPHGLLPAVLAHLAGAPPAAPPACLGERARWLASLEDAWGFVLRARGDAFDPAEGARAFEGGARDERLAVLARARRADAALGRAWVESVLAKEKADDRAALIEALEAGLSLADEALLERCLDDRAAGVRAIAAPLLAKLEGSALSRRMAERADALLEWVAPESGTRRILGLVKSLVGAEPKKSGLKVSPPAAIDPAWERDGVAAKPPQGTGERAFWLEETLARVAPARWERRFALAPAAIVAAAGETEWKGAVWRGLARAALASRARAWAEPFLDLAAEVAETPLDPPTVEALFALLPLEAANARARAGLAGAPAGDAPAISRAVARLVALERWDAATTGAYLDALARAAAEAGASTSAPHRLMALVGPASLIATRIPPPSLAAALEAASALALGDPIVFVRREVAALTAALELRQALHKEIVP